MATEFYKKERAVYLFIRHQKSRLALGFVYNPAGWGTFLVPASKIQIQTREKPWPVFKLEGSTVHSVRQIGLDRIFEMTIDRKGSEISLIFEAIGPNGNVWLLDCDGRKQATLRKRDFTANDPYQPPPAAAPP
ncbi:MAG: hypothetical protein ACE5FH_10500, partial [Candidatus Zixiibacteriota bacterium]